MKLKNILRKVLFMDKPVLVRVWLWSAILCLIYYLFVAVTTNQYIQNVRDIYIMAYGLASMAVYLLIYGFDWTK